jgi:UDP-GlcNAc3NAcA epimerase
VNNAQHKPELAMKILTVLGARPQFIKASAVSRQLAQTPGLIEVIVHTGQHHDPEMSDIFFSELDIAPPRHHLGISSLPHGAMTGRMIEGVERVLEAERPDLLLVYGDTNSTLAGALAAVKLQVPVAHVEAGLRSFNRRMPEEINRVLTDHVAKLLFCPTEAACRNLEREGIRSGVHMVGDVMYDATIEAIARAKERSTILNVLGLAPRTYAIATLHRAENTDDRSRLAELIAWLERQAEATTIVLPLHPRTRRRMHEHGLSWQRVRTITPVGYLDMAALLHGASAVFTDSGGLQKEAYFHRVPCVTLREETEWVETVEAGWNRLWQTAQYRPRRDISDYGVGDASARIVDVILQSLGRPSSGLT